MTDSERSTLMLIYTHGLLSLGGQMSDIGAPPRDIRRIASLHDACRAWQPFVTAQHCNGPTVVANAETLFDVISPPKGNDALKAGYDHVESMVPRADSQQGSAPLWFGWALREAFVAGAEWQEKRNAK